jgi:ATP-binding cassette subfamily B protein
VLTIVKGLFQFGQGYLGEFGAQAIAYDMRNDLYRHLQRLSFSWHDRAQTGQLMARATSDVEQLRNFTGRAFVQLAQFGMMGVGIGIILLATNWKLALASLLMIPLLGRTIFFYNGAVRPIFRQAQEEIAILAAIIQENLAGAKVVKAFARENDEIAKFNAQNLRLQDRYSEAAAIQSFTNPLMDAIASLGAVIVLWFGGLLMIQGEITVGTLVAFNTYLLLIIRPVRRLGFLIGQSSRAIAAGERIFEILDSPVELQDAPHATPLPPIEGHVVLDHVWCSYYPGEPVLRDVSLEARPGQVVALLGATGSGKTTIINLIPRFYDVTHGSVRIDGIDVRDVDMKSLREQIGIVLQDTFLFSTTVMENVRFGRPNATDEEVMSAIRLANADSFIERLPEKYQTVLGERGSGLSQGQRQLLSIARAALADPRILILDEATSSVDTRTERLIQKAFDELLKGRTAFVIAHRLSTIRNADVILVLKDGEIIERGVHDELLAKEGFYYELYMSQFKKQEDAAAEVAGVQITQ